MPALTEDPFLIFHYPLYLFLVSFVVLWFSAWVGASGFAKLKAEVANLHDDFGVIQGATLTLLGLIIGFTFSMALGRYDQRKNYEEEEANAIGTEYVRADLLPPKDGTKVRALLQSYLDQRVLFYTTRDDRELEQIGSATAHLQAELWAAVVPPALAQPTTVTALVVTGMNDVLNAQGYTQAAWLNRIPVAAWTLMSAIALCATVLVGIGARSAKDEGRVLVVLPFVISIAFFLIADIDSPRRGVIHVSPVNLQSLARSLHAQ